jgi:hypothetical protein
MKVMLDEVYDYIANFVSGEEQDNIFGKFVFEQYIKFDANIDWYFETWRDTFSDYIDDMIRVAIESLEDKDLDDICENIRIHRKASIERRK